MFARLRSLLTSWPGFYNPFGRPEWPSFASGFTSKKETRG